VRGSIRCTTWTSTFTLFDDFGLDVEVGVDVLRDASSSVVVVADAVTAAADLVDWQNLSENPVTWCRRTLTTTAATKDIGNDILGDFLFRIRWTGSKLLRSLLVFARLISRSPSTFILTFIFIAVLSIIVVQVAAFTFTFVLNSTLSNQLV
jgi:hypothetical protein